MAEQNSTCIECGNCFSFEVGKGKTTSICSVGCKKIRRDRALLNRPTNKCSIDGCNLIAFRDKGTICEAHYMRRRRHGSYEFQSNLIDANLIHTGGYVLQYLPSHPLRVGASARVYQHRAVYYDAFGAGPFDCHCCGKQVTWLDMHVDHLNDIVTDNRLENLAPACAVCNQKRGTHKMRLKMRAAGVQGSAHGLTMCQSEWARHLGLAVNSIIQRLKRGATLDQALTPRKGHSGPLSRIVSK